MRTGTLTSMGVAVACALTLPLAAQNRTADSPPSRQSDGLQTPPGAPSAGTVIEGEPPGEALPGQRRTANFPPQGEVRETGESHAEGAAHEHRINDHALTRWIAACNEAEIRVNEVAQQQAESDQVKQFAMKMIKEHGALGDKLRETAGHGQGERPRLRDNRRRTDEAGDRNVVPDGADTPTRRPETNRRGTEEARDDNSVAFQPGTRSERPDGALRDRATELKDRAADLTDRAAERVRGGNPLLSFHEEVTEQCAESTLQALKQKQGAKFDHAFMHQQLMAHMAMLDTLKVAGKHASPNLKPTIEEAQKSTQQHLDEAKQILEQIENQQPQ